MNVTVADNANVTQQTFTDTFNRSSASFGFSSTTPKHVFYIQASTIILLMVIALAGNVIVCTIMVPKIWRGNSIPLNVLVLSLAVSDVLKIGLESLPKAISYVNLQQWTMGEFACKVNAVFRSVFSNVSISTIALISFERFRSVDKPDGAAFSTRSLSVALLLVWVWNTAAASPQAIWFTTVATRAGIQCTIPFRASPVTALYTVVSGVVNFFIPLVISWACYLGVIKKMRMSRRKVAQTGTSVQQNNARARVLRRVTITCFMLMTLFTITLAPFQLALVVLQYGNKEQRKAAASSMKFLWLLTLVKSAANPFLYGIMWENFRKSVRKLLRPWFRKNRVAPATAWSTRLTQLGSTLQTSTRPDNRTTTSAV